MAALMCIKRADAVLGTDHSDFLERAGRGFVGRNTTKIQLPPYEANSNSGRPESDARGCANSYMCLTSPELWPAQAKRWYALYDKFFWQERIAAAGYREYPNNVTNSEWTMDVDAGPVVDGYGVAASAFGIGAARKNGRFDRAFPLSTEMLATVVELPNGVLAVPRLLSNFSDAPMLGEAGILWQLSIQPQAGFAVKTGGDVPNYVWIVFVGMLLIGLWRISEAIGIIARAITDPEFSAWLPRFQVAAWSCLMIAAVIAFYLGWDVPGFFILVLAVALPVVKKRKPPKPVDEWPEAYPPQANKNPQPGANAQS
jgi:hypothetical protein